MTVFMIGTSLPIARLCGHEEGLAAGGASALNASLTFDPPSASALNGAMPTSAFTSCGEQSPRSGRSAIAAASVSGPMLGTQSNKSRRARTGWRSALARNRGWTGLTRKWTVITT
jgi:hypothetical protein